MIENRRTTDCPLTTMITRPQLRISGRFVTGLLLVVLAGISNTKTSGQVPRVYRDRVDPHWFADGSLFWYRVRLADRRSEFVLVDTQKGTRQPAFDHKRLAAALGESKDKSVVLQADTHAEHGHVVQLMDLIQEEGATGLTIDARSSGE